MKLEFFVSHVCDDCPPAIDIMKQTKLTYETVNMTTSIAGLKRFLNYRDILPEFIAVKDDDCLGVPVLIVNDGDFALFDFEHASQVEEAIRQSILGVASNIRMETERDLGKPDGKMRKDLGL